MDFPHKTLARPLALAATSLALTLATTVLASPGQAQAVTGARRYIVHVGGCSGAVLNTRSGTWVMTASHCGTVHTVTTATGRSYRVVQRLRYGGSTPTGDVMLVQVNGAIKSAVGGGFALGGTPAAGSQVNVYGFPGGTSWLAGCSGLRVVYAYGRYPQVNNCYLPVGTSGGPWYTNDVVLHGVVGGLNGGGATNYITNTVPFSHSVLSWAWSIIY